MTARITTARLLLCLTTCALAAILLARAASAHLRTTTQERVLSAIEMLWRLDPELRRGGAHVLDVNGIRLRLRSGGTEQSPAPILERFGAICDPKTRADGGGSSTLALPTPRLGAASASGGYSFCLARPSPLTLGTVGTAFDEVTRSGDLSALGDLRGIVVHRNRVLTIESLGPIPLDAFAAGPAPTPLAPMTGLPMPRGQHLLSVGLDGRVLLTATRSRSASPLADYERSLRRAGLDVLTPPQHGFEASAPTDLRSDCRTSAPAERRPSFDTSTPADLQFDFSTLVPTDRSPNFGTSAPAHQPPSRSRVVRSKGATWIVVHELADAQDWLFVTRLPD